MTLVKDIRKTVTDTTPVFAAVGVTDLAVEKLRDARVRAAGVRVDLDVSALQDKAVKRVEFVAEQAQQFPGQVLNQTLEVAGKAHETYSELAVRGHSLVTRIRNQKATKDLLAQAGSTVSLGKGAVTTVRKAAGDTRRAAKSTLTTGRKSAVATRSSAKATVTTAKKSTTAAQRATKSAATSVRKTAAATTKAAETATTKIGD